MVCGRDHQYAGYNQSQLAHSCNFCNLLTQPLFYYLQFLPLKPAHLKQSTACKYSAIVAMAFGIVFDGIL